MKPVASVAAITEKGVSEAVEAYWRSAGYRVTDQVRIRTWRPDIVAIKGNDLIIVEAKGQFGEIRKALAQTALYATDASSAYLALPTGRITKALRDASRALGVGLMEVGNGVRIAVKAPVATARPLLVDRVKESLGRPTLRRPDRLPPHRLPFDKILRHRGILDALLTRPGRRFTIRELSTTARTPYATTWRIVEALRALGAITSERVGPSEYLSLNADSPVVSDLKHLHSLELAPHRLAAREFANRVSGIPEVEKVILFGSVAERRERPESDVDVAIVLRRKTERAMARVYEAASEVLDRTRLNVVPLAITPRDLEAKGQLGEGLRKGEVLFERA